MNSDIFKTPKFMTIMQKHLKETLEYFFEQNQHFAVGCEVKYLVFSPELPKDIKDNFQDNVLFIMGGYTFETARVEGDFFLFEAGFGKENFGSHVKLPILAIKQLFVDDHPVIINLASPFQSITSGSEELSMQSLLNNPKNKKLLQKKKK